MRRRTRALPVVAAALALTTAACGSTVEQNGTAFAGGGLLPDGSAAGDGLGGPAPTSTDGLGGAFGAGTAAAGDARVPGAASGASSVAEAGTATGPLTGVAGGSPGGTARSAQGAAPSTSQGVGVTATTINLGITYTENAEAANAAFGIKIASGDTRANAQAIIDDINERGGVAGRRLVPVFHAYDAQSSETEASQDQAACETLTQDNKVFAVVGGGGETWDACMKKAGVLNTVGATLTESDRQALAQKRHYFNAGAPTRDRVEAALVPALVRQRYFSGWDTSAGAPGKGAAVIGILGYNLPEYERPLNRVLLPQLKAAGHSVRPENIARISAPQSQAEQGPAIAEVQNTVLRFRQNGVTHLIVIDTGGGLTLVFTTNSRNQNYYPRLGVTSGSGLQGLYDAGVFSDRELVGAVGVAWAPSIDLPSEAGDRFATAATKRCLDVLKKRTGQQYASTNEASIALGQCDEINLAVAAMARAGAAINLSTAVAALEGLGDDLVLASRPAVFFGPDRHDGAELSWDLMWDTPCKCAKYVGPARSMR